MSDLHEDFDSLRRRRLERLAWLMVTCGPVVNLFGLMLAGPISEASRRFGASPAQAKSILNLFFASWIAFAASVFLLGLGILIRLAWNSRGPRSDA